MKTCASPMAAILMALAFCGPVSAQNLSCDEAETQVDLTLCAKADWQIADADLNDAYGAAMDFARGIDADLSASQRGAAGALKAAQRLWIQFRDATCEAEGFAVRGGSMEPMVVYSCMARVSQTRADELREMWYY